MTTGENLADDELEFDSEPDHSDELDRCDPIHLLSVMESIKLLLENPEISKRVLVTMLIEEDVLKHAIWEKYAHLADPEASKQLGTKFNGQRIARENCEKLLTVHLRLPPLEPNEVGVVVEKFAPRDEPEDRRAPAGDGSSSPAAGRGANAGGETGIKAAKLYLDEDVPDAITRLAANEIILGAEERTAIAKELQRPREGTNYIAPLGPRAVRAFIFRYQLTRLILAKRGITDWQPSVVIAALAQSLRQESSPSEATGGPAPEVASVIRQVT